CSIGSLVMATRQLAVGISPIVARIGIMIAGGGAVNVAARVIRKPIGSEVAVSRLDQQEHTPTSAIAGAVGGRSQRSRIRAIDSILHHVRFFGRQTGLKSQNAADQLSVNKLAVQING